MQSLVIIDPQLDEYTYNFDHERSSPVALPVRYIYIRYMSDLPRSPR